LSLKGVYNVDKKTWGWFNYIFVWNLNLKLLVLWRHFL